MKKKAYKRATMVNPFSRVHIMKIHSLTDLVVTAVMTLVLASSGSIQPIVENAAISITIVGYVKKLLDKKDR
jgi:hypothetical protein